MKTEKIQGKPGPIGYQRGCAQELPDMGMYVQRIISSEMFFYHMQNDINLLNFNPSVSRPTLGCGYDSDPGSFACPTCTYRPSA